MVHAVASGDFETPQSASSKGAPAATGSDGAGASAMSHVDRFAATSRRRWWLLLLALAVVLVAGWSGLWFYAASRVQAEMAAWRQREAEAGRVQECASETVGGYPLRIELRCAEARFELAGTPTLGLRLPLVLVAVEVYDPKRLTGEFTAPLEISEQGRSQTYVVNWRRGEASVRGSSSMPERASLVLQAPAVRDPGIEGELIKARRMELAVRPVRGSTPARPPIEIALRLDAAVADKLHPLAARPIDADITAVLRGVDDVAPKPWPVRFKEWQAHDGAIEIVKARIAQEDVLAVGAGTLKLTPRGGLDGNLEVTVVGIEKVLKMLDVERMVSEGQIGATLSALDRLIPGLGGIARQSAGPGLIAALGQRTVLEDKPALTFPLRFSDGTVFFGPFPVGEVPPLF
jgi:hypothetical protein